MAASTTSWRVETEQSGGPMPPAYVWGRQVDPLGEMDAITYTMLAWNNLAETRARYIGMALQTLSTVVISCVSIVLVWKAYIAYNRDTRLLWLGVVLSLPEPIIVYAFWFLSQATFTPFGSCVVKYPAWLPWARFALDASHAAGDHSMLFWPLDWLITNQILLCLHHPLRISSVNSSGRLIPRNNTATAHDKIMQPRPALLPCHHYIGKNQS
ncbi:hypothetical protein THASP1DRAFT_25526 [Thamnocephalis sphaerospora]|uniref:Uncharacterized protein n=1 Tax=Thamnocephalis sphaerospora TaxID=78915 RepID=A0A4P9XK08_9FUNG|nr:hypothetical protein THASP1DRAFT_25526 [Thamnocephalis sphaerospora]|eukprot:RKP06085.1 hypothetical protein THASP1DRAFT_25526 [Thamnocephalis sphaerospora]